MTWLRIELTTIKSTDRIKENSVTKEKSAFDRGRIDSKVED